MEKRNELGFLQKYQNPLIKQIQFCYDGTCTIFFKDGTTRSHFVNCEVAYNEQHGIPLSLDGTKLFVSSWERGLTAYDTMTGETVWHYKTTRVGRVFCFGSFLIAHRYVVALQQVDVLSGELRNEIKSRALERVCALDNKHLFVDRLKGKRCIMDAETMEIIKRYNEKIVNPFNCLSHCIREAELRDGQLFIEGFERCRNRNINDDETKDFYRMIDSDFYNTGDS